MRVDGRDDVLEYLRTSLPAERVPAVCAAYERAAKDGTAAFLTCYFLGLFGAHRMYLGDWSGAALRLIVPLGLVFVAIVGVLGLIPSLASLLLAGALLLIGLAWEVFDLTRIDGEVARSNLALAEHLARTSAFGDIGNISGARNLAPNVAPHAANAGAANAGAPSAATVGRDAVPSYPRQEWQPAAPLVAEPMPELAPLPTWPPAPEWNPGAPIEPVPDLAREAVPSVPDVAASAPAPEPIANPAGAGPVSDPTPPPQREITQPLPAAFPGAVRSERDAAVPDAPIRSEPSPAAGAGQQYVAPTFAARVAPSYANPGAPYRAPADEPRAAPNAERPDTPPAMPAVVPPREAAPIPEAARTTGSPTRPMKRIRVKRRIVVDGHVVGEQVIEELVPADMDTQMAAAELRARLAQMTPEQIAALANLPPDAPIELRSNGSATS